MTTSAGTRTPLKCKLEILDVKSNKLVQCGRPVVAKWEWTICGNDIELLVCKEHDKETKRSEKAAR